jgi:hypothetical protein
MKKSLKTSENKLNIKKATGYDGISPKILKLSMPCIVIMEKLEMNFIIYLNVSISAIKEKFI